MLVPLGDHGIAVEVAYEYIMIIYYNYYYATYSTD